MASYLRFVDRMASRRTLLPKDARGWRAKKH